MFGHRSRTSVLALATFAAALISVAFVAPGQAGAIGGATTTLLVPKSLCAAPSPGHASCFGMKLVKERVSTGGATPATAHALPALANGPAGGYTPAQLAKAYGLNVGAATTQTVAIVDAFDDPTALNDLNTFDAQYGLPAETATSFKKVDQTGGTAFPAPNTGWAGEITLDVQAVRGLCHKCKILLVEATTNSFVNLGTAVSYAAAHAKIVSNSYGGPESGAADPHYNHPGVAILASTGDDGWYGWDVVNDNVATDNVPSSPAAYNSVIAVGGTSLYLNADGTRAAEQVWNSNGPSDFYGSQAGFSMGAAGSGCSTIYGPQLWQQKVAGYSSLGCGTSKRSGVDIAAIADPFTGYDICQNYGNTNAVDCGWETFGGTSLASPVVAAMWGLAGGPSAVKYPALSLYGHFKSDATHPLYDVTVGGTGFCDTSSPTFCKQFWNNNPNDLADPDLLDCGFPASGAGILTNRYQCYAKPGYDGVAGVGTPKGVNPFKPMAPKAAIKSPGTVKHGVSHTFSAAGSSSPFPGGSITSYTWNWGDGHSTTTTRVTVSHKYASKGKRIITLTVKDNFTAQNNGRTGKKTLRITVR